MRKTDKFTYTDGQYFCNICDSPHEGEELAVDCFEACLDDAKLNQIHLADEGIYFHDSEADLRENISELESITYDPSFWKGPGWYDLGFGNKTVTFLGRKQP